MIDILAQGDHDGHHLVAEGRGLPGDQLDGQGFGRFFFQFVGFGVNRLQQDGNLFHQFFLDAAVLVGYRRRSTQGADIANNGRDVLPPGHL